MPFENRTRSLPEHWNFLQIDQTCKTITATRVKQHMAIITHYKEILFCMRIGNKPLWSIIPISDVVLPLK